MLARTRPSSAELIYSRHPEGFALHSMRGPELTRQYLQVPAGTRLEDWPDDRIWAALRRRLEGDGIVVEEGPVVERGLTPLRSLVVEPMQAGRLFLAGDAAHVVPPTGAKGLNLAVADVVLLSSAIGRFYAAAGAARRELLDRYSEDALGRVWRAEHFSWWMTSLLHVREGDPFEDRLQRAQLAQLSASGSAAALLAEGYTGAPFARGWLL